MPLKKFSLVRSYQLALPWVPVCLGAQQTERFSVHFSVIWFLTLSFISVSHIYLLVLWIFLETIVGVNLAASSEMISLPWC